ncbi:hypothetical protein [Azospirillum palustre]|nr:hypothetical protein [Azospirillum palustre]
MQLKRIPGVFTGNHVLPVAFPHPDFFGIVFAVMLGMSKMCHLLIVL